MDNWLKSLHGHHEDISSGNPKTVSHKSKKRKGKESMSAFSNEKLITLRNTLGGKDKLSVKEEELFKKVKNEISKRNLNENKSLDSLITLGSALKALPDGVIGGHLVLFGDKNNRDLTQQFFNKSTYFGHNTGNGAEVVFNHRQSIGLRSVDAQTASQLKSLTKTFMTNPLKTTVDAIGIFGEIAMDLSNQYEKAIYELAKKGILKWSAGAAPHLVDVAKNGHIKSFVITEGSLTPVPIEYRMINHKVLPLKSLMSQIEEFALK